MNVDDAVAELKEAGHIIHDRLANECNSDDTDRTRLREVVNARE